MTEVDYIIVGQGLAGTCLAWELLALGASVRVIDREVAVTTSRIAAGLITPVTGQRLVKSWRFEELRAAAGEFYRRVESELGCALLRDTSMVKVFCTETECEYFEKRMRDSAYAGLLREVAVFPAGVSAPRGGCELLQGGQLDVAEFLTQSRRMWVREGRYVAGEMSWPDDVRFVREGASPADPDTRGEHRLALADQQELRPPVRVELPRWGLRSRGLVFCEGVAARSNPWFTNVAFKPARGEMLIVEIPDWNEERIIHGGVWIAPGRSQTEGQPRRYRVGATYDWDQLDAGPTAVGRNSLIESLEELLLLPYTIVDHQAAVRPILKHVNPVIGLHPHHPQLGYFNGLGSKGSLQAPFLARQLASHLVQRTPLEREVDLQFRAPWPPHVS
jgi:glycine oxidase